MSVVPWETDRSALDRLELRAAATDEERRKAIHLMAGELAHDKQAEAWLESAAANYPGFRPEHTRVAVLGGQIAAALRMNSETMQIGEARLKMGGFGWVSTTPAMRRRGIASKLIRHTLDYMREQRYHASMLFGIPNFYAQFGFTTSLVSYAVSLDTVEALGCANPFPVYRAKPGDIPAILKLHQRGERDVSCTLIRNAGHVKNKWGRYSEWYVLRDDRGKVVGYFLVGRTNNTLNVLEAGIEEFGLAPAIVAAAADLADRESRARLQFSIPPSHYVSRFLQEFRATYEAVRERNAGGMLRILDVPETLESMIPEWECRLATSPAADARTELTIIIDHAAYRIRANRGAIDVAQASGRNKLTVTPDEMVHLLTGYRGVDDLLDVARTIITPDARALAQAIFPPRHPFVWRFDQF
jgi:predicted acetyltransferase